VRDSSKIGAKNRSSTLRAGARHGRARLLRNETGYRRSGGVSV